MDSLKVVSGYIPIPEVINTTESQFRALGCRLEYAIKAADVDYDFHDQSLPEDIFNTWMWRFVEANPDHDLIQASDPNPDPTRFAEPRNASKLLSNYVMHQKYDWLVQSALHSPDADPLVWIDFGVLKQEGMSEAVVVDFLRRLKQYDEVTHIMAPGIRTRAQEPDPAQSWDRFCGSLVIVPRFYVFQLASAMRRDAMQQIKDTKLVTIETNTLARVERKYPYWFRWYHSWWGASMFTSLPSPVQEC